MADRTKIEWTDATWNVVNGCSVTSPGCKHCYAMKQAHRVECRRGLTEKTAGGMVWTGEVRLNEKLLDQPLRWRRPRRIFVCAHGDLFHPEVPDAWIDAVHVVMRDCPHHEFQILTKRSARMRAYYAALPQRQRDFACHSGLDFLDLPLPNVWLGVSVEDQQRADERIPDLLATPAAVRFLSCEPLLGPVDLTQVPWEKSCECPDHSPVFDALEGTIYCAGCCEGPERVDRQIDWVIVGGESGPKSRPMHPDWARSLRDQCAAAGVPFLFKQWGNHRPTSDCEHGEYMIPASKKEAGRLLDGVQHDGFPA